MRMIELCAKGQQETDCCQINEILCLYISSAPGSHLKKKRTTETACGQESSECLSSLHSFMYLLVVE